MILKKTPELGSGVFFVWQASKEHPGAEAGALGSQRSSRAILGDEARCGGFGRDVATATTIASASPAAALTLTLALTAAALPALRRRAEGELRAEHGSPLAALIFSEHGHDLLLDLSLHLRVDHRRGATSPRATLTTRAALSAAARASLTLSFALALTTAATLTAGTLTTASALATGAALGSEAVENRADLLVLCLGDFKFLGNIRADNRRGTDELEFQLSQAGELLRIQDFLELVEHHAVLSAGATRAGTTLTLTLASSLTLPAALALSATTLTAGTLTTASALRRSQFFSDSVELLLGELELLLHQGIAQNHQEGRRAAHSHSRSALTARAGLSALTARALLGEEASVLVIRSDVADEHHRSGIQEFRRGDEGVAGSRGGCSGLGDLRGKDAARSGHGCEGEGQEMGCVFHRFLRVFRTTRLSSV